MGQPTNQSFPNQHSLSDQIIDFANKAAENPAVPLEHFTSLIARELKADACFLYILGSDWLELIGFSGPPPQLVSRRLHKYKSLAGYVTLHSQSLCVSDLFQWPERGIVSPVERSYRSFLGAPIRSSDNAVVGVLVVQTLDARNYTDQDVALLGQAAMLIAVVDLLKNRRLTLPETADFNIKFDSRLSAQQVRSTLEALADYYRACGGAGFAIDFEMQEVLVEELARV